MVPPAVAYGSASVQSLTAYGTPSSADSGAPALYLRANACTGDPAPAAAPPCPRRGGAARGCAPQWAALEWACAQQLSGRVCSGCEACKSESGSQPLCRAWQVHLRVLAGPAGVQQMRARGRGRRARLAVDSAACRRTSVLSIAAKMRMGGAAASDAATASSTASATCARRGQAGAAGSALARLSTHCFAHPSSSRHEQDGARRRRAAQRMCAGSCLRCMQRDALGRLVCPGAQRRPSRVGYFRFRASAPATA